MKKEEIVAKIKSLNLQIGTYVVYGSCPMAIMGLREANDIDLYVSPNIYKQLKKAGGKKFIKDQKMNLSFMMFLKPMTTGILAVIIHLSRIWLKMPR